ncbi:hypothetical protein JOC77_000033 [Peribacillus deserti]|uniref:Uncharacterized protein n=1 Tax=Peribacillus deserti TaxID=673318 RepID=A0ABS2QC87_9BACI|nr:hypothetical protein [Peribacillus deserti]
MCGGVRFYLPENIDSPLCFVGEQPVYSMKMYLLKLDWAASLQRTRNLGVVNPSFTLFFTSSISLVYAVSLNLINNEQY